jgi:hypothetical protein
VLIDAMSPAHRALVDGADRRHVAGGGQRGIGQRSRPLHRRAIDELVDMVQRHRLAGGQRGHHRSGAGRLDTQHRGVGRPLGEIGGDAGDAPATADRDHHQVGLPYELSELIEHFDGNCALTGHGAWVVIRRHQRGAGALDVRQRRLGGQIVGRSTHDQFDELPAVVADPVALLFGRFDRHVDAAVHTEHPARVGETLRVIARRRAHHARGHLVIG